MIENLTGKRFGHWVVLGVGERSPSGRFRWKCKCDCGNEKNVFAHALISGKSKSCGCGIDGNPCSFIDITGQRFGRLVAQYPSEGKSQTGSVYWICKCDCGNIISTSGRHLRKGLTRSCGCLHAVQLSNIDRTKISHKKHGACDRHGNYERLYGIWKVMKQRCHNPNSPNFNYYGGRGIRVCDEWRNDYAAFREWAMNNGFDANAGAWECTIDRIDNDRGYEPGNCRFVDMKTQAQNRRRRKTAC